MSVIIYIMDPTGHPRSDNPLHEQIFDTAHASAQAVISNHPSAKRADVEDTVMAFYLEPNGQGSCWRPIPIRRGSSSWNE